VGCIGVLCVDEKSQIQAADCMQPMIPAALNIATGKVIARRIPAVPAHD